MSDWVKEGEVDVDSGQIMITDPCYVRSFKNDEFEGEKDVVDFSYSGACTVTLSEKKCGGLPHSPGGALGAGFATSSGYGDGSYPVFVKRNKEGRIAAIKIIFTEQEDIYSDIASRIAEDLDLSCQECGVLDVDNMWDERYCWECARELELTDD